MTHPVHSEHCHCECDKLAERILKITQASPPSLLIMLIEDTVNEVCRCPEELLYKGDHWAGCASL
jgi:hypothetical protein